MSHNELNTQEKTEYAHSLTAQTKPTAQSTFAVFKQLSGSITKPTLTVLSSVDPRVGACATIAYHSWALFHSYIASKFVNDNIDNKQNENNNTVTPRKVGL